MLFAKYMNFISSRLTSLTYCQLILNVTHILCTCTSVIWPSLTLVCCHRSIHYFIRKKTTPELFYCHIFSPHLQVLECFQQPKVGGLYLAQDKILEPNKGLFIIYEWVRDEDLFFQPKGGYLIVTFSRA